MVVTTNVSFQKVQQQPTYRVLANKISEMIISGQIRPGEQLPSEAVLCGEFGVTRSTVRESIRLLEEMGMLTRRNQKRLVVSIPSEDHVSERTVNALLMRKVTVRNVYEGIKGIEPAVARAAAENATSNQIKTLRENVENTAKDGLSPAQLVALDAEFHSLVCDATNNSIFKLMRLPLLSMFAPMVAGLVNTIDTKPRMLKAHSKILEAIEMRDGDGADLWTRRHVEDFERGYEQTSLDFDAPVERDG